MDLLDVIMEANVDGGARSTTWSRAGTHIGKDQIARDGELAGGFLRELVARERSASVNERAAPSALTSSAPSTTNAW